MKRTLSATIHVWLIVGLLFFTLRTACCMSGWLITVQTDKPCYDVGNTVCISGRLTYNDWPQQSVSVSIVVRSSSGSPHFFDSATTDSNGNYYSSFTLGPNSELGTYVVSANAQGHANQTTFQVAKPIYIRQNGDVDPADAPISRNGNIYTLTANIASNATNGIIIERNATILDGAGFTLNGAKLANSNGIYLAFVNNVTIKNMSIGSFFDGVHQFLCPNCHIKDTNLFSNGNGIYYQQASSSTIEGNNITKNTYAGIMLDGSYDNNITMNRLANSIASNLGAISLRGSSYNNNVVGNNFTNNAKYGVYIEASYCNRIFHNNFFNNTHQGFVTPDSSGNVWDDDYPSGGNCWSDYNGMDLHSGPYQNLTGSDGIGDTPYLIYSNNVDHYPLMQPWTGLPVQSSIFITFSVNPVAAGSPVVCIATVSGSNPTGTVAWSTDSGTGHFSSSNTTLSSGSCSTNYTDTSPGNVTITASYSGDVNNVRSNSSATLTVSPVITFDQAGAGSDFTGTVVTIDGVNYTVSELPVSFLWAEGSSHNFSYASPLIVSAGKRYVWNSTTGLLNVQNGSLTVAGSGIVTGNYTTQYYLTAISVYDTAGGMGWYDSGATKYATLTTGTISIVPGWEQAVFTGWTGDAAGSGLTSSPIIMDRPKTAIADWEVQYYLQVATDPSDLPSIPGADWYNNGTWVGLTAPQYVPNATGVSGARYSFSYWDVDGTSRGMGVNPINVHMDTYTVATAHFTLQYLITFDETGLDGTATGTVVTVNGSAKTHSDLPFSIWVDNGTSVSFAYEAIVSSSTYQEQFRLDNVTGPTPPMTVTSPVTVLGNYVSQYYLTLSTSPLGVDSPSGQGWYDAGSHASISTRQYVNIVSGSSRYSFTEWTTNDMTEIADASSASTTVLMDKGKTVTADYVAQYNVTFDQSGVGSDCIDAVVAIDGADYAVGALPASFWWNNGSIHIFAFQSLLNVSSGTKQYNWTSTNGLSTLQSDSITVTDAGNVVSNYATLLHDVAVTDVAVAPTRVYQGYRCEIEVSIANTGDYTETFNVTVYANTTIIGMKEVTLPGGNSTTLALNWNTSGFAKSSYTMSAVASTVPHETDTADNTFTDGQVTVAMIGDVNGDGRVDVKDVYRIGKAFGSAAPPEPSPPDHPWDPDCDINNDGKVNMKDYYIVCQHYGEEDP